MMSNFSRLSMLDFCVLIYCICVGLHIANGEVHWNLQSTNVSVSGAPAGPIDGFIQRVSRSNSYSLVGIFLGIPFAKPPIGDLRLKRPVPLEKSDSRIIATSYPKACYQIVDASFGRIRGVDMWNPNHGMSEDCLYLNIWLPNTKPKAVMVWIYGGGFMTGTSTLDVYDGKFLAAEKDVVVVSMNYRVGPLGFMYLGDDPDGAPGNMGLLDQNLALKWVRDNIKYFGAPADKITIFGESAGAGSVALHTLSKLSQPLYDQAIMESGSPLAEYAYRKPKVAKKLSLNLAKAIKCPTSDMKELVKCLKKVDAKDITDKAYSAIKGTDERLPFQPTRDAVFLTKPPIEYIKNNELKKCPIMIGSNKDEGMYFLIYKFPEYVKVNGKSDISEDDYADMVKRYLVQRSDLVQQAAYLFYQQKERETYVDVVDNLYGDERFICPIIEFADYYQKWNKDTFMYRFYKRSANNPWPEWMGVMHGYEIEYIFGLPFNRSLRYDSNDLQVSKGMMTYWTNFAITGNPNEGSQGRSLPAWPKYTDKREFLFLDTQIRDGEGPRQKACEFWNKFVPELEKLQSEARTASAATPTLSINLFITIGLLIIVKFVNI